MSKAKDVETKKLLIEKRNEFLSLDKKAKRAKLKEYIRKAPEKDRAAAELKLRNELKKTKSIKESVLFEIDSNGDGIISKNELDAANAANLAAYRNQSITTTRGAIDDYISANNAHAAEMEDVQSQIRNVKLIAIGMGILIAILVAVIIALLVRNAQLA